MRKKDCRDIEEGHFVRRSTFKRKTEHTQKYISFSFTLSHGVGFICANIRAKLCTVN